MCRSSTEGRGLFAEGPWNVTDETTPLNVYRRVWMNQRALAGSSRGALCLAGLTQTVPGSISVWASRVGAGPQAGRDPARSCPQPGWATEASASRGPPAPGPGATWRVGAARGRAGKPGLVARPGAGERVPPSLHGSPQGGPRHPSCDRPWLWFCRAPLQRRGGVPLLTDPSEGRSAKPPAQEEVVSPGGVGLWPKSRVGTDPPLPWRSSSSVMTGFQQLHARGGGQAPRKAVGPPADTQAYSVAGHSEGTADEG